MPSKEILKVKYPYYTVIPSTECCF